MRPMLRLVPEGGDVKDTRVLSCIRCKLKISYADRQALIVSDLLATHWADDHHLPEWRDTAAACRDRLWRRHPDLLEQLTRLSSPG